MTIMRRRRIFIVIPVVLCAGVLLYAIKCQLGIDFIKDYQWEEHFPVLNIFQKYAYTVVPRNGLLLNTSFDDIFPYESWIGLWAREKGMVTHDVVPGGRVGSKCLVFESHSDKDWAMGFKNILIVQPGDKFFVEGYARVTGQAVAQICFVLWDEHRNVVDWTYALQETKARSWSRLGCHFAVPAGVKYMRLQMAGHGMGDACFDDIRFVKE